MKMSESIKNLAAAMYAFRKAVKQPKKDKENPFFKSTYVALEGVQKAIDEALPDGLSYTQALITEDGRVGISTIILHKSGEFMAFERLMCRLRKMMPKDMDQQKLMLVGILYPQRLGFQVMLMMMAVLPVKGRLSQQVNLIAQQAENQQQHQAENQQQHQD
ncbi:phage-associated recombinase [Lentilactobacillus farraginis DSM 18382 = JCM 14108]|uniref:Phage-associated recombinase n=1 Tax=Lentilactobacillus farraginis DSM 18382 = JCM 14108 TaxID=1423743 RepID=X0PCB0_9LACO|nr:ERF family protein [Lentilactobacillus farraginis]GAF37938.1 phage-associated recombinase [Lentilactobacillus farraginis DSM 18382 = JCM 14108]